MAMYTLAVSLNLVVYKQDEALAIVVIDKKKVYWMKMYLH